MIIIEPPIPWTEALGPLGALVLLIIFAFFATWLIWLLIKDLMKQRDFAQTGWREQTAATKAVAEAVEERNRLEAEKMKLEEAEARGKAEARQSSTRTRLAR